jgi:hypothetical protein
MVLILGRPRSESGLGVGSWLGVCSHVAVDVLGSWFRWLVGGVVVTLGIHACVNECVDERVGTVDGWRFSWPPTDFSAITGLGTGTGTESTVAFMSRTGRLRAKLL